MHTIIAEGVLASRMYILDVRVRPSIFHTFNLGTSKPLRYSYQLIPLLNSFTSLIRYGQP